MCGICGLLLLDSGAVAHLDDLRRMNATIVHRGPDDEGFHIDGPAGLAMRRLSIIDIDGGKQPIANEDGTLHIVYNGEIYNYLELRAELVDRGHRFRTGTDTEVILHLYEDAGEECVNRLRGMFAFAIWDSRRRRIFLARDRMGIKPLFYAHEPGKRFLFGSEMKAVLAAGVSREPNWQGLYDFLSHMYVPTPDTAYVAVKKLPPACWASCDSKGMEIRPYWDIPLPPEDFDYGRNGDREDALLEKIQEAVRSHMIADVEVGALLSGGLDSTLVTAIMARKLDIPVKTFTAGFDHRSYDESSEARLVARTLGTEHFEEIVRPGMIRSMADLLAQFDEPFGDYSSIPTFLVSRIAARSVKVVLTGDGGDEVFAGYPTHVAPNVARLFRHIPRPIRERVVKPLVMALPTSMERISFDYKAKRFVTGADLSLERGHYWWKVIFDEQEKRRLLTRDFLDMRPHDSFRIFERYFDLSRGAHPLNRLLYVDARTFLLDDNLPKVDRMTMANSLEARVPLLDHELIEHVAMLPPETKTGLLQTKTLLRKAAADLLPRRIRKGKKKGFTPPLPLWIRDEMREFVMDCFTEERLGRTGILEPAYCRTLLREHLEGKKDNNRGIWCIVALVHWLEGNNDSPRG